MGKIFYQVPLSSVQLDAHTIELAVFRCVDGRFRTHDQAAMEQGLKETLFDLFGFPAPAKLFVVQGRLRDTMIEKIKAVCMRLHRVKRIMILGHWDCGGYGGSKEFSSPVAEAAAYEHDLLQARKELAEQFPTLEILAGYSMANQNTGMLEYYLL